MSTTNTSAAVNLKRKASTDLEEVSPSQQVTKVSHQSTEMEIPYWETLGTSLRKAMADMALQDTVPVMKEELEREQAAVDKEKKELQRKQGEIQRKQNELVRRKAELKSLEDSIMPAGRDVRVHLIQMIHHMAMVTTELNERYDAGPLVSAEQSELVDNNWDVALTQSEELFLQAMEDNGHPVE